MAEHKIEGTHPCIQTSVRGHVSDNATLVLLRNRSSWRVRKESEIRGTKAKRATAVSRASSGRIPWFQSDVNHLWIILMRRLGWSMSGRWGIRSEQPTRECII